MRFFSANNSSSRFSASFPGTVRRLLLVGAVLALAGTLRAEDWTRFRGPNGSGIGPQVNGELSWSGSKNIKWKVALPGPGASSPIVLGDQVFVTCYTGFGVDAEQPGNPADLVRHLLCFDANTGKLMWNSSVPSAHDEDEYQGFITEHGYASSTPVTDGERIYVFFDKSGVFAFDLEGRKLWATNVGTESDPYKWGGGASAIVYKDLLIVPAAIVGHAILALNKSDGSEAWRYVDPELTNCWSTPILVTANGRDELVTCVPGKILGLDPKTGNELWFSDSPITSTTCASLVEHNGAVFAMGGRAGDAIGVRCGGSGDVSESHTLWQSKLRSGIGTPVVVDGNMYWTATGIAFCANCETGEYVYRERLGQEEPAEGGRRRPAGDYASAIAIGNQVLLTLRSGITHVIEASPTFKPLRENSFGDDAGPFHGTPAASGGRLYFRSNTTLYCVAQET